MSDPVTAQEIERLARHERANAEIRQHIPAVRRAVEDLAGAEPRSAHASSCLERIRALLATMEGTP